MGGCSSGAGYYYGGGYYGGWPGQWRPRYNLTRYLLGLPQAYQGEFYQNGYAATNDYAVRYPYPLVNEPPFGYGGYGYARKGC